MIFEVVLLLLVTNGPLQLWASVDKAKLPLINVHSYWTAYINLSYIDQVEMVWQNERTETGRYGNNAVKEDGGLAVRVKDFSEEYDNSGCRSPFKSNYPLKEKWIAVIERGKCTFNQKIVNAMAHNASGVLIYDNEEDGVLQSMQVEAFPIPAVFTYRWKGLEILNLMNNVSQIYITLEKGSNCVSRQRSRPLEEHTDSASTTTLLYCNPPKASDTNGFDDFGLFAGFWNLSSSSNDFSSSSSATEDAFNVEKRTSVLFVSVSFVVLMVISLAWLVFYYVQRFRYIHAKDQLERKLCNQAKRALSIISTNVLKKDDLEMKDFHETCAVCIEAYRVSDVVRILPCKHQFHKTCIDQWLLEKRTCPMCKMDILKHYGLVEDGNSSDREDAIISLS